MTEQGDLHTEMTREECFAPRFDLWYPRVEHKDGGNTTEDQNADSENDQASGVDSKIRHGKRVERKPGPNVDETATIQYEIDDGRKGFSFRVHVEVAVPRNSTSCQELNEYACVQSVVDRHLRQRQLEGHHYQWY